ncbi:MAG: type II secretion system secretin GspD [Methylococcales bacterium]|nr:type II secretion system secretin GspD [Methylococcales bacterium]
MRTNPKKRSFQGAIIACSLLTTGCELLGPDVAVKLPLKAEVIEKPLKSNEGEVAFTQLKNQDDDAKKLIKPKSEQFKGTGRFIDPNIETGDKPKSADGKYSLNFDDADLGEVSKIILSDMLGENYVLNPSIAGKVTLQTTQPLTKAELLPTLEMLLRMNDVALIKSDGIYRIEPNAKALQASGIPTLGKPGKALAPGYQTKIVPLRFIGANDMMDILTPLLPDKSVVRADPARNILLISGTSYEIEKILEIVQTFDVNFMSGMSFGLYPLENVDITDAITQLEQIFNKEEKTPLSGMIRFVPIKHLNAVLIVTQQPQYLEEAKNWVARLDKTGSSAAEGGFVVYRVQHVDAVELAATLSSIVTGVAAPKTASPSTAPGQPTTTLTNKAATQPVKKATPTNAQGAENELTGMQVIADEANNALVITAKPQQYRLVKKIIEQLDVMPLQVLIDATIVAVTLTDNLQYGVKWLFEHNPSVGDTQFATGGGAFGSSVMDAAKAAAISGFTYGFLSNAGGPSVVLQALANSGNLNVLSSPSLMVLNNKEASIHVGDTIPFQSGTSLQTGSTALTGTGSTTGSLSGSTGLLSQNTQIKTGVDLKVKPRVNANGIVIMDIEQKVNDAQPNSASPLTPTILERDIKSSVAVVSGETIVLGGLISESNTLNSSGIPWLKDLPLLGSLFSDSTKNKQRKELIVLITPRVVENKYDARKVAQEFKQKLSGIYYDMPKQKEASILPALNR